MIDDDARWLAIDDRRLMIDGWWSMMMIDDWWWCSMIDDRRLSQGHLGWFSWGPSSVATYLHQGRTTSEQRRTQLSHSLPPQNKIIGKSRQEHNNFQFAHVKKARPLWQLHSFDEITVRSVSTDEKSSPRERLPKIAIRPILNVHNCRFKRKTISQWTHFGERIAERPSLVNTDCRRAKAPSDVDSPSPFAEDKYLVNIATKETRKKETAPSRENQRGRERRYQRAEKRERR